MGAEIWYADITHKYKIIQGITNDICPGNICPWDICPYQQYLSCYWPDLDQTLNKGPGNIYNRLQLPPGHLSRQHLSWGHLSISAIPQLLQALIGSNFKQKVLGIIYNRLQLSPQDLSLQHLSWGHLSILTLKL